MKNFLEDKIVIEELGESQAGFPRNFKDFKNVNSNKICFVLKQTLSPKLVKEAAQLSSHNLLCYAWIILMKESLCITQSVHNVTYIRVQESISQIILQL